MPWPKGKPRKPKGETKMVEQKGEDKMIKEEEGVRKVAEIVAEFQCKRCGHTAELSKESLKTPPYRCRECGASRMVKSRKTNEETGQETIKYVPSFEIKKL